MMIIIAILLVVYVSVIRKFKIDHWLRVVFRLVVDIVVIIVLGPIFGLLYAVILVLLSIRYFKNLKQEEK